jgi:hypothetical protein
MSRQDRVFFKIVSTAGISMESEDYILALRRNLLTPGTPLGPLDCEPNLMALNTWEVFLRQFYCIRWLSSLLYYHNIGQPALQDLFIQDLI